LSKKERPVKKEYIIYLVIFFACVASRLLTIVPQAEDPESDFYFQFIKFVPIDFKEHLFSSLINAPLFINEVKLLSVFFRDIAPAFALAGGLATFLITIASLRLLNRSVLSFSGALLIVLIFFNPLIWFFGNHYSPDLTGAALLMLVIAIGLRPKYNWDVYVFWIALGFLVWVKMLYLIAALPIVIFVLIQESSYRKTSWIALVTVCASLLLVVLLSGGKAFWIIRDGQYMLEAADLNAMDRAEMFFKTLWANAAGGWWYDRPLWLVFPTAVVIFPIIYFLYDKTLFNSSIKEYLIIVMVLLYAGVVFFIFNEYTIQGSILPLVPLFLIMTVYGIEKVYEDLPATVLYTIVALGMIFYVLNTISINKDRKTGTALIQIRNELKELPSMTVVTSSQLIGDCLHVTMKTIDFKSEEISKLDSGYFVGNRKIPAEISNNAVITTLSVHTHNNYTNPVWPSITLYKFKRR